MINDENRIKNEIDHGAKIKDYAENVWNWNTHAGKIRWERRVRLLSAHLNSKMCVLEIGCGTGLLTKELQNSNADVNAIDISPDLLDIAKKRIKSKNIKFKLDNAYDLSFDDESFDTVIGSSILHHLNIKKALVEFYRVLKPGGTIYFTEPNMLNPIIAVQKNIPFIKKLMGDTPDETAFIKWKIISLLKKHKFKNIEVTSFDFLHPSLPKFSLPIMIPFTNFLEKFPLISEIAGSLYIKSKK